MLDFGVLPPEVNSGRMYTGPGSGPIMAAASAWDALAAEVSTAAAGYGSVISELVSGPWVGPASTSMVSAVAPYVTWLSAVSTQAEETADQARAAAAAYEAAFMMTVPPAVIAANRALLMTLVATNFFGQNTPAIMATEAQYLEMWAQDAAAMYGYAASSTAASALTPFDPPPNTTSADPPGAQSAAVSQAAADPPGNATAVVTQAAANLAALVPAAAVPAQTVLMDIVTAIENFFNQILMFLGSSGPGANNMIMNPILNLFDFFVRNIIGTNDNAFLTLINKGGFGLLYQQEGIASFIMSVQQSFLQAPPSAAGAAAGAAHAGPVIVRGALGGPGGLGYFPGKFGLAGARPFSMHLGLGAKVGGLSVPGSWSHAEGLLGAEEKAFASGGTNMNGLMRGVPLGGLGGRQRSGYQGVRYGFRYDVVTHPPSAG